MADTFVCVRAWHWQTFRGSEFDPKWVCIWSCIAKCSHCVVQDGKHHRYIISQCSLMLQRICVLAANRSMCNYTCIACMRELLVNVGNNYTNKLQDCEVSDMQGNFLIKDVVYKQQQPAMQWYLQLVKQLVPEFLVDIWCHHGMAGHVCHIQVHRELSWQPAKLMHWWFPINMCQDQHVQEPQENIFIR